MFGIVRSKQSSRFFEFLGQTLGVGRLAFDDAVLWPGARIGNVLIQQPSGNRLVAAKWALLPESMGESPAILRSPSAAVVPYPDSQFWRPCYQRQRCAVVASGVIFTGGDGAYLLQSSGLFLLGGLYRQWENAQRAEFTVSLIVSAAPTPVSRYSGHWLPLFLPLRGDFVHKWLDPETHELGRFRELVERAEIPPGIRVIPLRGDGNGQWEQNGKPVLLES